MDQTFKQALLADIDLFEEKLRAHDAGEMEKKAYKGFSGGYGSYAQRNGGNMIRLRMAGGRLCKDRLKWLAEQVEEKSIDRLKLTTCQTVQMHNVPSPVVGDIMRSAIDVGIYTRGGGGDFPRNVMVSPLSGVEAGEYFDVRPWAEAAAEYLLTKVRDIKLPRKLKVAFSNGPANTTHATIRDLGFAAREDGTFDVYCAGGMGPNAKVGVKVAEAVAPRDVCVCVDAMISVFTQFGNYENRAKSRTRYLQDTLGVDGLKAEFAKAMAACATTSPKLACEAVPVVKAADGTVDDPRAIPQKQSGLYAVSYHPLGGNLDPKMPRILFNTIREMDQVELRIAPGGTLYAVNLTGEEAKRVLAVTQDGAKTPFEASVCCIGASICQQGVRDSQALLAKLIDAVRAACLPASALPTIHISGCPSSCGAQQIGVLGFQGGVKLVDGKPQPAFNLTVYGEERQGAERLGKPLGSMVESDIPAFMVELGRTVAASGQDFMAWLAGHEAELEALAARYIG